jgi:hypothetical protein
MDFSIQKFNELSIDMKNIAINYFILDDNISILKQIILDEDLSIEFEDKLHILIKCELYDEAYDYICSLPKKLNLVIKPGLWRAFNDEIDINDIPCEDEDKIYKVAKDIETLLRHTHDIDTIFEHVFNICIFPKTIELINDIHKVKQIYQYIFTHPWELKFIKERHECKLPLETLKNIIDTLAISYEDNFKEKYEKLERDQKDICMHYLINKKRSDLLQEIVLDDNDIMDFKTKINILLKNKLYDQAYNYIINYQGEIYINFDIFSLLNYLYKNENDYDIIKLLELILGKFKNSYNHNIIFEITNNLPKHLNKFREIFITLCDMLENANTNYVDWRERCKQYNPTYATIEEPPSGYDFPIDLKKLINEYNLGKHLSHFISLPSCNNIITNIIAQNMLNQGIYVNFEIKTKMIILTSNIYNKNRKHIDHIIQNIIIKDHNMLFVLHKNIPKCHDIHLLELQTFLQKIQNITKLSDDEIYNKFTFCNKVYCKDVGWLFDFFIENGYDKCLRAFLSCYKDRKYDRTHISLAKKSTLNVLLEFSDRYIMTKHQIPILLCY